MGDSNFSCCLTGVTIRNADCVFLPLTKARYSNGTKFQTGSSVCSNEGALVYFQPLTLPIAGHTDGYSGITDIEKGPNTRFIEQVTGLGIDEFCEGISRANFEDGDPAIKKLFSDIEYEDEENKNHELYGTWFHREAWDHFSKISFDGYGRRKQDWNILNRSFFKEYALTLAGFEFVEENKDYAKKLLHGAHDPERYREIFKHPSYPNVFVMYDGHMSFNICVDYKYVAKDGYSISDLIRIIEGETKIKFPEDKMELLKNTSAIYCELMSQKKKYEDRRKFYVGKTDFSLFANSARYLKSFSDHMLNLYQEKIWHEDFVDLTADTLHIFHNMHAGNRLLMPTFNGTQYGCKNTQAAIAQFATKLAYRL